MRTIRLSNLTLDSVALLVDESERSGWRFMRRLIDEWLNGINRFDKPGESLFAALDGEQIVGTCGLNIDPYAIDSNVGRLRRLYVLEGYRGRGIGRQLIEVSIKAARPTFLSLRVRTENPQAGLLYERVGFVPVINQKDATHILMLG
jgi:GNAT superfamily N-acetyltransferase